MSIMTPSYPSDNSIRASVRTIVELLVSGAHAVNRVCGAAIKAFVHIGLDAGIVNDLGPHLRQGRFRLRTTRCWRNLFGGDDAASGLRNRVRANLLYLSKAGTVVKDGKGPGATWRLK